MANRAARAAALFRFSCKNTSVSISYCRASELELENYGIRPNPSPFIPSSVLGEELLYGIHHVLELTASIA